MSKNTTKPQEVGADDEPGGKDPVRRLSKYELEKRKANEVTTWPTKKETRPSITVHV